MGYPIEGSDQDLVDRRRTLRYGVMSDCGTLEAVLYEESKARGLMNILGKGYKLVNMPTADVARRYEEPTPTGCHCKASPGFASGGYTRRPHTFHELIDRYETLASDHFDLLQRVATLEQRRK